MAVEKRRIHRVVDANGSLVQVLPETSAEQVKLADSANNYTATDVEGALAEIATQISGLETDVANAGKVDDVQDVNGASIVTNKVAKLTKASVGLGNVDNTADANKTVKHASTADTATKVSNKLAIKGTTTNGAEYDGSMPIALAFNTDDLSVTQSSASGTATVTVGVKDKGYSTKTYVDTELAKKYDKTGGTISGNVTISGDVVISGNATIGGETTTVNSTQLEVQDALITVAKGNVLPLTTPAGIVVPKADGTNDVALVVDNSNMAKVGKVVLDGSGNISTTQSDLQTLATRRDDLTDGALVKYNADDKTLETDTRQYAQKDVDETISGNWTFSNANGFKTNAIENTAGNRVFDYDGTNNRFGSEAKNTIIRGLNDRPQYQKNGGSPKNIALVEDITGGELTIDNATNAENVTTTINGKAISDIFETNGTTAKNATNVASTINGKAISDIFETDGITAKKASKLATARTISISGDATGSTSFDGSANANIAVTLANSGATAGTYTAVQVNAKGIVTKGGQTMSWGTKENPTPVDGVIVGGIVWEYIE